MALNFIATLFKHGRIISISIYKKIKRARTRTLITLTLIINNEITSIAGLYMIALWGVYRG